MAAAKGCNAGRSEIRTKGTIMADDNPSVLSHLSIGTNDFEEALTFYDAVLGTLGCSRELEHPGAVAYGKEFPEFWDQTPIDGEAASVPNGIPIEFLATTNAAVDAFYEAALQAGGKAEGAPGPRPEYGEPYYGCFVRDLDGDKIEAMC